MRWCVVRFLFALGAGVCGKGALASAVDDDEEDSEEAEEGEDAGCYA